MNLTIFTPASRPHLWAHIVENIERQRVESGINVQWYPIIHGNQTPSFGKSWIGTVQSRWTASCGWNACYYKLNEALNEMMLEKRYHVNEYISFLCDDDLYENGWAINVNKTITGASLPSLIVTSMRYQPGGDLIAKPENLKVGSIGLEQYLVRADVAVQHRFVNEEAADGEMIVRLSRLYPVRYVPDAYVKFNALKSGWWPQ